MSTTTTTTTLLSHTPTFTKSYTSRKPSPLSQSFTPDDLADTPTTIHQEQDLFSFSSYAYIAIHTAHTIAGTTASSDPTMSVAHTYFLAHLARDKLSRVVARPERNLRLLVGHANLLDTLCAEITASNAAYSIPADDDVDDSLATALSRPAAAAHVRWGGAVVGADYDDEDDDDWSVDSSDDEDDEYTLSAEDDDDEEDLSRLGLVRTSSRSAPPELASDDEVDSDDDEAVMPPSPPQPTIDIYRHETASDDEADEKPLFEVPPRSPARVISGTGF